MNIAIIAHDGKKELMAQFCTAYAGILARHTLSATGTTGAFLTAQTGIPIRQFMNGAQGGIEQIGARIALDEIDLVLFFSDPDNSAYGKDVGYLSGLCVRSNVPFAINTATAEALVLALDRGDLNWRETMRGSSSLSNRTKAILGLPS